jgi:mannose-6-phosphate isomerase-like protein (cupin superfamily)
MRIVDLEQQPHEEWRVGVMTRMKASATDSATQLCMFEQWCEPGHGAPTHLYAIEEVLCVRDGQADVWVDDTHATLTSGKMVIVPAGRRHGFSNNGKTILHIESTLAAPVFEAVYDDKRVAATLVAGSVSGCR